MNELNPVKSDDIIMNRKEKIKNLEHNITQKLSEDVSKTSQEPEATGDNWDKAVWGKFYRLKKEQRTVRLDADVTCPG